MKEIQNVQAIEIVTSRTISAEIKSSFLSMIERSISGNQLTLTSCLQDHDVIGLYDQKMTIKELTDKLNRCGDSWVVEYMYDHQEGVSVLKARGNHCGERCCPKSECVDSRIQKIKDKLKPWFDVHNKRSVRHIILTTPEIPQDKLTRSAITEIRKKVHSFTRRLARSNYRYKGLYVAEYKYDPIRGTYKIHFHLANFNLVHDENVLTEWWRMSFFGVKHASNLTDDQYVKCRVKYKSNSKAVLNYLAKRAAMAGLVNVGWIQPVDQACYADKNVRTGDSVYYVPMDKVPYLSFVKGSRLLERYGTFTKGVLQSVKQLGHQIKKNQRFELICTLGSVSRGSEESKPPDIPSVQEFERKLEEFNQLELPEIFTQKTIMRMAFRDLMGGGCV